MNFKEERLREDRSEQDELTHQRRRNYNREYLGCADFCPVCKADDITADDESFDGPSGSYSVHCDVCGSTWMDLYTLQAVEITKDNYDPEDVMSPASSPVRGHEEDYRTHDLNTSLGGYSADCGREV